MNNLLIDSSAVLDLEPQWVERALSIGNNSNNSTRKFNLYIQTLALFSFESWLSTREPALSVNLADSSIFKPDLANIIDVVSNIQVGDFKICLIPTLDGSSNEVTIPRYVTDIPEFTAHFYVVVEIDEELEVSLIKGFINYNHLSNYKSCSPLEIDWNYSLPLEYFELQIEKLLVNLQCLTPEAIRLPEVSNEYNITGIQSELREILPQISDRPLWKNLTWSQASIIITNPGLRNWLYESLTNKNSQFEIYLGDLLKLLTKQAINLRDWIQTQLNYLEPELTWQMLPSNVMLASLRDNNNPSLVLDNILNQIGDRLKINIPSNAGRAYQEFDLKIPLRLYAVTWLISETEQTWGLLLIVGGIPKNIPPYGVKLRVSDRNSLIQEQELTSHSGGAYLCTHLEAGAEDKLLVTITSPDKNSEISRLFEFRF